MSANQKVTECFELKCTVLKEFRAFTSDEIYHNQLEWVALITQFQFPIDIDFFKPYWVWVSFNASDFYIDLSSYKLSIFELEYDSSKLHTWKKRFLFKDITELLLSVDDRSINLDKLKDANEMEYLDNINKQ